MKITILGTGMVGQSLSEKFIEINHDVTMGTKNPEKTMTRKELNPITSLSFSDWHKLNSKVKLASLKNAANDENGPIAVSKPNMKTIFKYSFFCML